MGRWSARHRKTAIFGWLAFVSVAFVLGGMVGTKTLDPEDAANGEAATARQMIDRGAFEDSAEESIFVQSGSKTAADPAFKATVREVVEELSAVPGVQNASPPTRRATSP
jgi:RND superfamily putative drug exporter